MLILSLPNWKKKHFTDAEIQQPVLVQAGGWRLSETRKMCGKTYMNQIVNRWRRRQRELVATR